MSVWMKPVQAKKAVSHKHAKMASTMPINTFCPFRCYEKNIAPVVGKKRREIEHRLENALRPNHAQTTFIVLSDS